MHHRGVFQVRKQEQVLEAHSKQLFQGKEKHEKEYEGCPESILPRNMKNPFMIGFFPDSLHTWRLSRR